MLSLNATCLQVDRDELERIALNIARNAVPPAAADGSEESAEAAARLNMTAAVAEQAEAYDSTDPLGYGRIDTRLLTLVSGCRRGCCMPCMHACLPAVPSACRPGIPCRGGCIMCMCSVIACQPFSSSARQSTCLALSPRFPSLLLPTNPAPALGPWQSRGVGLNGTGSKPRYSGRISLLDTSGRRQALAGRGRGDDAASTQGEAPAALRAKVLPGSEQFDAALYLGTLHAVSGRVAGWPAGGGWADGLMDTGTAW